MIMHKLQINTAIVTIILINEVIIISLQRKGTYVRNEESQRKESLQRWLFCQYFKQNLIRDTEQQVNTIKLMPLNLKSNTSFKLLSVLAYDDPGFLF